MTGPVWLITATFLWCVSSTTVSQSLPIGCLGSHIRLLVVPQNPFNNLPKLGLTARLKQRMDQFLWRMCPKKEASAYVTSVLNCSRGQIPFASVQSPSPPPPAPLSKINVSTHLYTTESMRGALYKILQKLLFKLLNRAWKDCVHLKISTEHFHFSISAFT